MDRRPSRWWLFDILVALILIAGIFWYLADPYPLRSSDQETPSAPSDPNLNATLRPVGPSPATLTGRYRGGNSELILADDASLTGLPCGAGLRAETAALAMITLIVADPCRPNSRMLVQHAGLRFTFKTDGVGYARVEVPALTHPAEIQVEPSSGLSQSVTAEAPELTQYERVAVYMSGNGGTELHIDEVWVNAPRTRVTPRNAGTAERALNGTGGYLRRFGSIEVNQPVLAQVYTVPRDALDAASVRFRVVLRVTEENCGIDALGGTVQSGRGDISQLGLEVPIPDCQAAGDMMTFRHLFRDLTLGQG